MINVLSLKKGDIFWECCKYHWRVRLEFVKYDEFLNIVVAKYTDNFGIYKKGQRCEVVTFNECFINEDLAIEYQNQCKNKVKQLSKDTILKLLFEKCHSFLSEEERKLYKEIIYSKN